jgi:hypothetical protein
MGKGDKPRNCFSREFKTNYEAIEWRNKGTYCCDCGRDFKPEDERNYYCDGHAHCKQCNYN